MASDPADLFAETTTATFKADVIEASHRQPVIVELCSGNRGHTMLGVFLDKVVRDTGCRIKLLKLDVDENPTLVGSIGPRMIPGLFAYVDGKPGLLLFGSLATHEEAVAAFVQKVIDSHPGSLAPQEAAAAPAPPAEIVRAPVPEPHIPDHGRVFISHVAEDREAASELVRALEGCGCACWIAPRNVSAGKPYDDEIVAALESCRAMVLIFSALCNSSDYIRREVTVAGEFGKHIIPYRIEDVTPQRGLRIRLLDLHWIDAFAGRDTAVEAVVRALTPRRTIP